MVLTPASLAPLWGTVEAIEGILSYPDEGSARDIAAILDSCNPMPDSALLWEGGRAAQALAKVGLAQRIGYQSRALRKLLTHPFDPPPLEGPVQHQVRYYLDLLVQLGVECYQPQSFETQPLPPRPQPPRIALVPGSSYGAAARWGVPRFVKLAEQLQAARTVELVSIAEPGHDQEARALQEQLASSEQGAFRDDDLLEFLPHCSVVVANDGPLAHLAAHFGVPVVALFGPGDPIATRPLGRQHAVLSEFVECSPCLRETCPIGDHRCLEELSVSRVLEATLALLPNENAPSPG